MMRTHYGHEGQARILVAGRDRTNALTLSAIPHRIGCDMATALDGEEAVVKVANFTPDLFIIEPFLGWLSGMDATTAISAALPACRLLLSSGASSSHSSKAARKHLVYSFISNPILLPIDRLNAGACKLPAKNSFDDRTAMSVLDDTIAPGWQSESRPGPGLAYDDCLGDSI
jgi:DNA-binding NtrC family response regulator